VILLIDNYDSFVHNLARYLRRLGQETLVVRNDRITVAEIERLAPAAIVISPGPCSPAEAGVSVPVVRELHERFPILGICLGHQSIGAAFGARVVRAAEPMHGRASLIRHDNAGLFHRLPNPLRVGRYHSLVLDRQNWPNSLVADAWTLDGTVMSVRHRQSAVYGLQFHPESVLTECGYLLLERFLAVARLPLASPRPTMAEELAPPPPLPEIPANPVTF
jgi:anthranilate synthase/aminodeoxychorismate synthase-like glutamine amidotransferase